MQIQGKVGLCRQRSACTRPPAEYNTCLGDLRRVCCTRTTQRLSALRTQHAKNYPVVSWFLGMPVWIARHVIQVRGRPRPHRHYFPNPTFKRLFATRSRGGRDRLAFRRSTRKRLKRFHRPAIPAASEITLSMSRGFTSSSEWGAGGARRTAVGEGVADGKPTFVTSASYSRSTPTKSRRQSRLYLTLHRPFFLPPVDQTFADTIALLQEARDHTGHLPRAVVTLDYGLVLVNDHGYALEERCQSGDVVQRGRCCVEQSLRR